MNDTMSSLKDAEACSTHRRFKLQESWAIAKMTARCALCMGSPEKFRESLTTPMATYLESFNGHLFRLSLLMCTQNLKFVALPVPEIIGEKIGQSLDTPTLPVL